MTEIFQHPDPFRAPQYYDSVPAKRLVAWVLDSAFSLLLTILVIPFTAFTGIFFFVPLWFLIGFGYRIVTIATGSATWGMRVMSIELRDAQGQRFDFSQALLHTLGFTISMSFVILQIGSIITILGSAKKQSLPDMALGSVMINRP